MTSLADRLRIARREPTERRTASLPVRVERRGVPVPEWIRRAREAKLPAKVFR